MDREKIIKNLIKKLLKADFKVQRYNAYSTNSIYLKLDYGVACSIRISDHPGKKKLRYRFNLMIEEDKMYSKIENGLPMFFYGISNIDKMLEDIIKEKEMKINKYGGNIKYNFIVSESKERNKDSKGFWENADELYLDKRGFLQTKKE